MLNQCILIGRLTRDPALNHTAVKNDPVLTFSLAVERPFKNSEGIHDVDFINVVTWNRLAEHCAKYLQKGSMCAALGRLQVRSYEDSEGNRRKVYEIVAENVRFLSHTKMNENSAAPETQIEEDEEIEL